MAVPETTKQPRTVEEAIAAEQAGRRLRYLHFWGHRPARDGRVDAACLSQWWPVDFTEDGRHYRSAEHYMMAHKALLFGDDETAAKILAAGHPGEAKTLGRGVRGFDDATSRGAHPPFRTGGCRRSCSSQGATVPRLTSWRAMTLRWISLVPSPTIIRGASRK
jgi:hypothetical protein